MHFNLFVSDFLICPIKVHFKYLYNKTDPIQLQSESHSHQNKYHLKFALFIMIIFTLYGTIGFQYESIGRFDLSQLSNNSLIFTHQLFPPTSWLVIDIVLTLDISAAIVMYFVLISNKPIDDSYKMVIGGDDVLVGSKVLEKEESLRILQYRTQIKSLLFHCLLIVYLLIMATFFAHVYFFSHVIRNLTSAIYWIGIFPLFIIYLVYALFGSTVYVILACRYIRIRQQILLNKFMKINRHFRSTKITNKHNIYFYWWYYLQLNKHIVHLCRTIKVYRNFCSPLLSAIFPFYISVQCYMAYIVLYIETIPTNEKPLFVFGVAYSNMFMFVVIDQCAGVVRNNRKLEMQNRAFYQNFKRQNGFALIKNTNLLKAESFQLQRRLHSYAFRVFGYHRITSNTFNLIISYITLFFMFICKDQSTFFNSTDDSTDPFTYLGN